MSCDLHPLHKPEFVASHVLGTGKLPGARCTGRTTAAILKAISECYEQVGVPVRLKDHGGYRSTETILIHNAEHVRNILDTLEFSHFHVWFTQDSVWIQFGGDIDVIRRRRR
jgi:hypothetical protein